MTTRRDFLNQLVIGSASLAIAPTVLRAMVENNPLVRGTYTTTTEEFYVGGSVYGGTDPWARYTIEPYYRYEWMGKRYSVPETDLESVNCRMGNILHDALSRQRYVHCLYIKYPDLHMTGYDDTSKELYNIKGILPDFSWSNGSDRWKSDFMTQTFNDILCATGMYAEGPYAVLMKQNGKWIEDRRNLRIVRTDDMHGRCVQTPDWTTHPLWFKK